MVLNPDLYRRLRAHFGDVRVVNEGEEMIFENGVRGSLLSPRRVSGGPGARPQYPRVAYGGEQYAVNCPRCGDTRMRLVINHRFPQVPFAKCHNEDCFAHPLKRDQLKMLLFYTRTPPAPRLNRGYINPDAGKPPEVPRNFESLADLPADHKARTYLADERGFDPDELSETYGVGYCGENPNPLVRDRIIVPLVQGGVLFGWQARFIGERNWKATDVPKYYTAPGTKKNQVLYGIDRAKSCPFAVLVEGVTDVWSVGPCATALLGKTISFAQSQLIAFRLRNHPLVVMLDADARAENAHIVEVLRRDHPAAVVLVDLPDGTDPGSLSREANMEMIRAAARTQGASLDLTVEAPPNSRR
jgi:hypothetical protein